ncbi:hypothetical protein EZS27_007273, partial [termite gut metagenome]
DPLRFYRHIALLGRKLLSNKGKLYFEINPACSEETAETLRKSVIIFSRYGQRFF